jgi:hypothetical protein
MKEYRKTGHVLPREVIDTFARFSDDLDARNHYIAALRQAGWTLSSISVVTGLTRERIRQIVAAVPAPSLPSDVVIPEPPVKAKRAPKVYVEPDPRKLARLLELQPLAQQNRHNSDEFREAAEQYTALVWEVHSEDGVTLYRLAKRLGVTHGALRFRLARYGYKEPESGRYKVYTRIDPAHRVALT